MIINLEDAEIEKCQRFAETIDTKFYEGRNQLSSDKRIKDQVIGKLGEIVAFKFFQTKELLLSEPDFEIYDKSKKSWDYDLKHPEFNLHVKTRNAEHGIKYGFSWIFEKTDNHVFKEFKPNDYACFTSVDLMKKKGEVKSILKIETLHKLGLFKKPKLDHLTTKLAVYWDDVRILKQQFNLRA